MHLLLNMINSIGQLVVLDWMSGDHYKVAADAMQVRPSTGEGAAHQAQDRPSHALHECHPTWP